MIEWIVTSSVLILLVAFLRVIIKGRVNPRLRYALWGLVLLRLLIPGTLWESRASVMTPVAARQEYQAIENIPSYIKTQPDGWIEIGTHGGQNWTSIPPERLQPGSPVHYDWPPVEAELETLRKQVSIRDAFLWAWLAGSAVVGVFLLAVNLKFNHNLKKNRRTLEQYRGRWVFTMDGLPTPCLFGLFRPAVYLTPDVAADESAKAHVLAHEYAHFRQGDHVWSFLRGVCLALHWYNPLVWLAAYLSRRDCELSCDEGAVRLLGEDSRADYGRTLVELVARRTTPKDLVCCATTMTGGKSALKERIALLVKRPRTTVWMACVVAAACIVFAVCTFTGAAADETEPEPEADAPEEVLPANDENLPDVEDLPTAVDWDAPIWVLDRISGRAPGEYIFIYQDAETGVNYLRKGDYLQELETRNMYDRQGYNDIEMTCRDLDGDDAEEIAIVYHITSGTGVESRELLICDWDGQRWTERHPEGVVSSLVRDFQDSYEISTIWSDPGMGDTPGPSILSVNWDRLSVAFEVSPWLLKTGGTLECSLDEWQYTYYVGRDGGIELMIAGEASYADSPVEDSRQFWYACPVAYRADGTFAVGPGALNTRPPEDLPTEPMDLSRPAEEQGPWLLLAETPGFDIALYRSAWDNQHVYLRVTNGSFQAFNRDLSGMELLPALELVEGDADLTVRALYRRYEGTYFNGTSYEPGVVADQALYLWSAAEKYWREAYITTQPAQLTEDLPVIAELPGIFGIYDWDAPMWWVGTVREEGISLYWAQYEEQMYLRYGDHIQRIDDELGCEWLPELYFEDLDDDGGRELLIHYHTGHGTGVHTDYIAVHEWDGESWHGTQHTPDETIEVFNNDLDLIFECYEDGTAFIKNRYSSILLDLSHLWEAGYWESSPKKCSLVPYWTEYAYQNGQITLTIAGGLWDEEERLYGYAFEYVCPVGYMEYGDEGYLGSGSGVLQSEYAAERSLPELTDTWRKVLEKILTECDPDYPDANVYAVHDVNGDGEDELIVIWYSPLPPSVYSRNTEVYDAKGKGIFGALGELTFYSNGAISTPWSHNQGPACAMWPYDLYVCDAYTYNGNHSFLYSEVGSARARSDDAPGFEDVAYADLDGDGVVYYIDGDAFHEENPVDNAVYEAWLDQYLAGAQVLPVQYFPLTEDTVSSMH
ncbi:MAG: M56 family metallopeptidase [Oscillibacter sp.]|nr:M56 family metallopeptidase [Oscillibacter sp.]